MNPSSRRKGEALNDAERDSLRKAFVRGDTIKNTATLAGVAAGTTHRYFKRFEAEGLVRGPVPRRVCRPRLPVYTGPDWIGERVTSARKSDSPVVASNHSLIWRD